MEPAENSSQLWHRKVVKYARNPKRNSQELPTKKIASKIHILFQFIHVTMMMQYKLSRRLSKPLEVEAPPRKITKIHTKQGSAFSSISSIDGRERSFRPLAAASKFPTTATINNEEQPGKYSDFIVNNVFAPIDISLVKTLSPLPPSTAVAVSPTELELKDDDSHSSDGVYPSNDSVFFSSGTSNQTNSFLSISAVTIEEEKAAAVLLAMMNPHFKEGGSSKNFQTKRKRRSIPVEGSGIEWVDEPLKKKRRRKARRKIRQGAEEQTLSGSRKSIKTANTSFILESGLTLAQPDDPQELNSLHCFVRSELLEVFTSDKQYLKDASADLPPKVGLRCVYCGSLPRNQKLGATMSVFYPKSLDDLYRSVCSWQRVHFRKCLHMPSKMIEKYRFLKNEDRTRGKKIHWFNSAYRMGLRDVSANRDGIVWNPEDLASI